MTLFFNPLAISGDSEVVDHFISYAGDHKHSVLSDNSFREEIVSSPEVRPFEI